MQKDRHPWQLLQAFAKQLLTAPPAARRPVRDVAVDVEGHPVKHQSLYFEDAARAELALDLASLLTDEAVLVCLWGEPGMGKTTFLHHLAANVLADDAPVLLEGNVLASAASLDETLHRILQVEGDIGEVLQARRVAGEPVLVLVDNADELGERELNYLAALVPWGASVLLAASELAWVPEHALDFSLQGIPGDEQGDALRYFAHVLDGREPTRWQMWQAARAEPASPAALRQAVEHGGMSAEGLPRQHLIAISVAAIMILLLVFWPAGDEAVNSESRTIPLVVDEVPVAVVDEARAPTPALEVREAEVAVETMPEPKLAEQMPRSVLQEPPEPVRPAVGQSIRPAQPVQRLDPKQLDALLEAGRITAATEQSRNWLTTAIPERYTLQLMGARDVASIRVYLQRYPTPSPAALVRQRKDGADWYVLLGGDYADRPQADAAAGRLQKAGAPQPWPRRFADLRQAGMLP